MTDMTLPVIGITMGDAAGIGPEIAVKACCDDQVRDAARVVVIGSARAIEAAVGIVKAPVAVRRITRPREAQFEEGARLQMEIRGNLSGLPVGTGKG